MNKQPLAEVFGFPVNNFSSQAQRYRQRRLCPFNNRVPNCTKDKAKNPLGVCSVFDRDKVVITCPIRFRQDWIITDHAADFFFPPNANWTSLTEVRLDDRDGRSAGNIDVVLVSYDQQGKILDFGSVEIQAVYISGNIRLAFEYYLLDPINRGMMDWSKEPNYPRPDYLSSSRKRLAPQLIFKGGILNHWEKKQVVVVDKAFFSSLPQMKFVPEQEADLEWLVYDLVFDSVMQKYQLELVEKAYTSFIPTLSTITTSNAGSIDQFVGRLQNKLDEKLENLNTPDAPVLGEVLQD